MLFAGLGSVRMVNNYAPHVCRLHIFSIYREILYNQTLYNQEKMSDGNMTVSQSDN